MTGGPLTEERLCFRQGGSEENAATKRRHELCPLRCPDQPQLDQGRSSRSIGQVSFHVTNEIVDVDPHPHLARVPAEPFDAAARLPAGRGCVSSMKVQVGRRHVDDSLDEPGMRARPPGGVPETLQHLVGLPPVREVVQVDPVEVGFERPPLLG